MDRNTSKEILAVARRLARVLRPKALDEETRLLLCRQLLEKIDKTSPLSGFASDLRKLPIDERHYWIGTFYTLLMPETLRRSQAAYFTPPHLSRAVVALLSKNGFLPKTHSVLDPAAGGAAFLSTLAAEMRVAGATSTSIISRLKGIEIDRGLARLSESLIAERLGCQVTARSIVSNADALRTRLDERFDLVIANPPFGRVLDQQLDPKWGAVCHSGHINKYALFTKLCFDRAKAKGLVALVLPSSFIAGPLYDKLRTFIRARGEVLLLGSVVEREDVFVDVDQDISVLVARAGQAHSPSKSVAFGKFTNKPTFTATMAGTLPTGVGARWNVPMSRSAFAIGGATLEDYGVSVKAGYFVWNRELDRMEKRRGRKNDLPLIWARNVRAGSFCEPKAKKRRGIDYVRFDEENAAIVRAPALVMQRTTNNSQRRRLIVARVAPSVYTRWGGFISENHTIVLTGPNVKTLDTVCALLNSEAVDRRYRQLSGTASISVKLLRDLDLPTPESLTKAISKGLNPEDAVREAYESSSLACAASA